jgi:hypothetical protein
MIGKPLIFIASIMILFGCKNKLTKFHIDYNSKAIIQSSVPINSPFNIYTPEQETNSSVEFEVNDTRKDLIELILLKELTIEITNPENQNFNFLKSVEVFINSENFTERKVAFNENVPSNVKKIECEVLDVDLQEYIKEDHFSIRIRTVTDQILTNNVELDIYSNFFVEAKIFK